MSEKSPDRAGKDLESQDLKGQGQKEKDQEETGIFSRDMGISHADFLRLLPEAIRYAAPFLGAVSPIILASRQDIRISIADHQIDILLKPEDSRQLSTLTLPQTTVIFRFSNALLAQSSQIMSRIDMAYRRGGG